MAHISQQHGVLYIKLTLRYEFTSQKMRVYLLYMYTMKINLMDLA